MADFFEFLNQQWMLVSLLVVLVLAYSYSEKSKGGKTLSFHAITQLINKDEAVALDVREPADYKAGHIVNAINIPHNKVNDRIGELSAYKDKTLVLVDKMGTHTGAVGQNLKKQGFTVVRLEGGMSEWQSQKLPVVKG